MKCTHCKRTDKHIHYELKEKLNDKGFPTHEKEYKKAHRQANKKEKLHFGEKNFISLGKVAQSLKNHELLGKNTKKGKIQVSKKVPKNKREEVAYHENAENKFLKNHD